MFYRDCIYVIAGRERCYSLTKALKSNEAARAHHNIRRALAGYCGEAPISGSFDSISLSAIASHGRCSVMLSPTTSATADTSDIRRSTWAILISPEGDPSILGTAGSGFANSNDLNNVGSRTSRSK